MTRRKQLTVREMHYRINSIATALERQLRRAEGMFRDYEADDTADYAELLRNLDSASAYADRIAQGASDAALLDWRRP